MIDANQKWDVDEAVSWVSRLAEFKPLWIEEPTSPDDILGHATISKVRQKNHAHKQQTKTTFAKFFFRLWLHTGLAWQRANRSGAQIPLFRNTFPDRNDNQSVFTKVSQQGDVQAAPPSVSAAVCPDRQLQTGQRQRELGRDADGPQVQRWEAGGDLKIKKGSSFSLSRIHSMSLDEKYYFK